MNLPCVSEGILGFFRDHLPYFFETFVEVTGLLVSFLFPLGESWGSNLGSYAWWQVPVPTQVPFLTCPKSTHFEGMKSVELLQPPGARDRLTAPSPMVTVSIQALVCVCTQSLQLLCFPSVGSLNGEHQP